MKKVLAIAAREYEAVVRSKAFLVSIILLPVLMVGSMLIAKLTHNVRDATRRTIAVIDRTPGEQIFPKLEDALKEKKDLAEKFALERVDPATNPHAIEQQSFELSERVRGGTLGGILEIGHGVPSAIIPPDPGDADTLPDDQLIRFRTNTPAAMPVRDWAKGAINRIVQQQHLSGMNLSDAQVRQIQSQIPVVNHGLSRKNAAGAIEDSQPERDLASFLIPFGLVFLMFVVVIIGAVPMLQGIVEEKQNRIAEVLLGSVSPFALMAGKVLGIVATSTTLIVVYLTGAYFAVRQVGLVEYMPAHVIAWFLALQFLSVLMYGSLYIALGAACTDSKEMQSLLVPVNLVMAVPLMLILPILMNPSGMLAKVMTWFPPATPFITLARLAVPPGMSGPELAGAIGLVLLTTLSLIWASGRIFRVGILMQGKGANLGQLAKWVVRG